MVDNITWLILFYLVLFVVGGGLLVGVNRRAGQTNEQREQPQKHDSNPGPSSPLTNEQQADSARLPQVPAQTGAGISDRQYREALRKSLGVGAESNAKPEEAKDAHSSDKQYRDALRAMHQKRNE
ncbi:hypothetical protein [Laceyella putida]|uniref:Uncharacterized protein n=1 Tax=Laceyella putida TaxID=110101 RepID=A0ABW2RGW2_9BACL